MRGLLKCQSIGLVNALNEWTVCKHLYESGKCATIHYPITMSATHPDQTAFEYYLGPFCIRSHDIDLQSQVLRVNKTQTIVNANSATALRVQVNTKNFSTKFFSF